MLAGDRIVRKIIKPDCLPYLSTGVQLSYHEPFLIDRQSLILSSAIRPERQTEAVMWICAYIAREFQRYDPRVLLVAPGFVNLRAPWAHALSSTCAVLDVCRITTRSFSTSFIPKLDGALEHYDLVLSLYVPIDDMVNSPPPYTFTVSPERRMQYHYRSIRFHNGNVYGPDGSCSPMTAIKPGKLHWFL